MLNIASAKYAATPIVMGDRVRCYARWNITLRLVEKQIANQHKLT